MSFNTYFYNYFTDIPMIFTLHFIVFLFVCKVKNMLYNFTLHFIVFLFVCKVKNMLYNFTLHFFVFLFVCKVKDMLYNSKTLFHRMSWKQSTYMKLFCYSLTPDGRYGGGEFRHRRAWPHHRGGGTSPRKGNQQGWAQWLPAYWPHQDDHPEVTTDDHQ